MIGVLARLAERRRRHDIGRGVQPLPARERGAEHAFVASEFVLPPGHLANSASSSCHVAIRLKTLNSSVRNTTSAGSCDPA